MIYNFCFITYNISNGTAQGPSQIAKDGFAIVKIVPESDYNIPFTVQVTGASYGYNQITGILNLYNPTGIIKITATCTPRS